MEKVWAISYSATGNTDKTVEHHRRGIGGEAGPAAGACELHKAL